MDLALKFVYGDDSAPILENRVQGTQALSGTGGLRVFGELMRKHGHKHIYVPNPTWGKMTNKDCLLSWQEVPPNAFFILTTLPLLQVTTFQYSRTLGWRCASIVTTTPKIPI